MVKTIFIQIKADSLCCNVIHCLISNPGISDNRAKEENPIYTVYEKRFLTYFLNKEGTVV